MPDLNTVGVNVLWLTPGVVGGSEEYTIRLLRSADDINRTVTSKDQLRIRLYLTSELLAAYPELGERFECVIGPDTAGLSRALRVGLEHSWLTARSHQDMVLHHAGGTIPAVRSAPPLVTVHDLQPLEHPENFSTLKRQWLQRMIPRAVHAARVVLCPSQFTADRIVELLGVSEAKVVVVSHGHDFSGTSEPGSSTLSTEEFGTYVLYPAIMYRHKRHVDIVRALYQLRERRPDLNVVFTGRRGPEHDTVTAMVKRLGMQDRVHILGRVPAADLDALYASAAATVIPSSYEGFGNPALEAMARGCPLLVADAAALPEVVGPRGTVVGVGDIDGWVAAIDDVVSNPETAALLVEAGLERAASYDWSTAGSALLDVYRNAVRPYRR